MKATFFGGLALLALPGPCAAQDTETFTTDLPRRIGHATTVPIGQIQVEGGYTVEREGDETEHQYELLLRIPASSRSEWRIGFPEYTRSRDDDGRASGLEDFSLGYKRRVARGSGGYGLRRPRIALTGQLTAPTGVRAFRERHWRPGLESEFDWNLSRHWELSAELGYAYDSEDGLRFHQLTYGLAVEYKLSRRWDVFAELFGNAPDEKHGPNTRYVEGGLTFLASGHYKLGVRAGVGLNGVRPDHFFGFAVSRR